MEWSAGLQDIVGLIIFSSDHQTFWSLFKACHGCNNQDNRGPLLWAAYEVILLHPSKILAKSFWLTWGSNRCPSDCELSTLPLDHSGHIGCNIFCVSQFKCACPCHPVIIFYLCAHSNVLNETKINYSSGLKIPKNWKINCACLIL